MPCSRMTVTGSASNSAPAGPRRSDGTSVCPARSALCLSVLNWIVFEQKVHFVQALGPAAGLASGGSGTIARGASRWLNSSMIRSTGSLG